MYYNMIAILTVISFSVTFALQLDYYVTIHMNFVK